MSALITAESIIAGFMITYGALGAQLLIKWGMLGLGATTYMAEIMANAIILTSFTSILILFRSIKTPTLNTVEYDAGYNLFILSIFGSAFFVVVNSYSISHCIASPVCIPISSPIPSCGLATWGLGLFLGYALFLLFVWICPYLFVCPPRKVRFLVLIFILLLGVIMWAELMGIFSNNPLLKDLVWSTCPP